MECHNTKGYDRNSQNVFISEVFTLIQAITEF